MTVLTSIEFKFIRRHEDGRLETVSAQLTPDTGWQQWGAPTEVLGDNVGVMEAVSEAAAPFIVTDD